MQRLKGYLMSCNEKYPSKRGYAVGKLYKFLKERKLYKEFVAECKRQNKGTRGNTEISTAFVWCKSVHGTEHWKKINNEFERTL